MKGNITIVWFLCILSLYTTSGYIVDTDNGNDNNNGETINDPFKTITRCVEALANPGDECLIRAGTYHEVVTVSGLQGTQEKPFRIAGYEDERPVWDGSVQVRPDEWNFHEATKICTAKIDEDITALFYKGDLLTAARWPNSKWSDKSFFDHQYWRPCPNSERGTIVDDALAEANLDFTGAMAILNIGSWETYVAQVLSYDMGSNYFTYNDTFGDLKFKHQQYYLEASHELLDAPEEWFYDVETKKLSLIMPSGDSDQCPDIHTLRGRTLDNVLEIKGSSNIIVGGITFFASNIIASDSNSGITFDSLIFNFPTSSHRMLKSAAFPRHTLLYGNNNAVINCTFMGSDGPALQYNGDNLLVHNSEFSYNDWVGHGNGGTVMAKDTAGEFSQNSLYYNGVAHGLRYTGRGSNITLNHMEGQCWGMIQEDGASIQISTGAQDGIKISYEWIHNSPKKGIRFDGNGDPLGLNGYVGYNVVWNAEIWDHGTDLKAVDTTNREIYTKGDQHTVTNNVAWDDLDDTDCTVCVPTELQDNPMNENTVVTNNGAQMMQNGGGVIENNYESLDVKDQMVDTNNYDFRPVQGGAFITPDGGEIIGAYTNGESSLTYWIPGRKLYKASFPIPKDGATVSAERSDVICQTGYLADKHDLYFGDNFDEVNSAGKDDAAYQMTLQDDENIFALPTLESSKQYFWRVDTHRGNDVFKGDVWSFTTA